MTAANAASPAFDAWAAVAEAFVAKFQAKVATMAVGNAREGRSPLGAAVGLKKVEHDRRLGAERVAAGGVLTNGGDAADVLMPTHVVDMVTPAMKQFRKESFVAVVRARNEAHAIELANDTDYGLSGAVSTRSPRAGRASQGGSSPYQWVDRA